MKPWDTSVRKELYLLAYPHVHCMSSKTEHDRGHHCSWDVPPKLQDKNIGQDLWSTAFFWSTRSLYCSGVVWGRYTGLIVPADWFWKRVFQTSFLGQIVVKSLAWFKRLCMISRHALVPLLCHIVRCRKNFYWPMPQTKSVIKGKSTVQDTTLSSIFLVRFRTFREKITGLFILQDLFKCYVPIIFPKLIERI